LIEKGLIPIARVNDILDKLNIPQKYVYGSIRRGCSLVEDIDILTPSDFVLKDPHLSLI